MEHVLISLGTVNAGGGVCVCVCGGGGVQMEHV